MVLTARAIQGYGPSPKEAILRGTERHMRKNLQKVADKLPEGGEKAPFHGGEGIQ